MAPMPFDATTQCRVDIAVECGRCSARLDSEPVFGGASSNHGDAEFVDDAQFASFVNGNEHSEIALKTVALMLAGSLIQFSRTNLYGAESTRCPRRFSQRTEKRTETCVNLSRQRNSADWTHRVLRHVHALSQRDHGFPDDLQARDLDNQRGHGFCRSVK